MQPNPQPPATLRPNKYNVKKPFPQFVCKSASAGSRHTLLNMINCRKEHEGILERSKKVLLVGLNQVGLCEDTGYLEPIELEYDFSYDPPSQVAAGNGTCFIVTKRGYVISFGFGNYGILGHGNDFSNQIPQRIKSISQDIISKVSVGRHHAVAITKDGVLYSWGRNDKGQCGLGFESPMVLTPTRIVIQSLAYANYQILDVCCGEHHTIALIKLTGRGGVKNNVVYGWGDSSRGQLGSLEIEQPSKPQELRSLTRYLKKKEVGIKIICAGGYHNFIVTQQGGQVVAWGKKF